MFCCERALEEVRKLDAIFSRRDEINSYRDDG